MKIIFDIIAISCGRMVVPLNSSISVKVEVWWEEGSGMINTFSIFFRPTSNYDYPCSTRSVFDWFLMALACMIPLDVAVRRVQLDFGGLRVVQWIG